MFSIYHYCRVRHTICKHGLEFLKNTTHTHKISKLASRWFPTYLISEGELCVGWGTPFDMKHPGENEQQMFAMETSVTMVVAVALHFVGDMDGIVLMKKSPLGIYPTTISTFF